MIYLINFGSEEQRRFLNTPLINEMLRYFDGKINKTEEKKFIYYSGHDRTVSMVLSAFNYSGFQCSYYEYLGLKDKNQEICK